MKINVNEHTFRLNFRYWLDDGIHTNPRDGTIVELLDANDCLVSVGFAFRNKKDRHCKETARKASIVNMFNQFEFTKEERSKIWFSYHNRNTIKCDYVFVEEK
jgi:hypothetical protein